MYSIFVFGMRCGYEYEYILYSYLVKFFLWIHSYSYSLRNLIFLLHCKKVFRDPQLFGPKILYDPEKLVEPKIVEPKQILDPKLFWNPNIFYHKFFSQKTFLDQNIFGPSWSWALALFTAFPHPTQESLQSSIACLCQ